MLKKCLRVVNAPCQVHYLIFTPVLLLSPKKSGVCILLALVLCIVVRITEQVGGAEKYQRKKA